MPQSSHEKLRALVNADPKKLERRLGEFVQLGELAKLVLKRHEGGKPLIQAFMEVIER